MVASAGGLSSGPPHFLRDGGQVKAKGPVTRQRPTRHPGQRPSPAAAEEEQVLHGRDGGAGVLASDQVAVQHHVHGVRLAGCRRPPGAQASGHVLGQLPRPSRTCPPRPGTRGQGLAPEVLWTLSPCRRPWPGPPLTTEAGPRVLHEVLHDQRQVGEAGRPDELVHGRLRGKGTQAQRATPATWGLLRVEGPQQGPGLRLSRRGVA